MSYILIILILLAAGAALYALVRGLIAFVNMEVDDVDENGVTASHKKQNEMMFKRVKYQAIAVVLVALLLLMAGSQT